uniref:Uncharacterized protein n=1 Tax=Siphoviridae sp. ctnPP24 TaxID=2825662 RepID=A0A8S5TYW7_9CAUD|nr:MAG TPA: hypothetical protein [Siphoviridae sp. ctnPP24]
MYTYLFFHHCNCRLTSESMSYNCIIPKFLQDYTYIFAFFLRHFIYAIFKTNRRIILFLLLDNIQNAFKVIYGIFFHNHLHNHILVYKTRSLSTSRHITSSPHAANDFLGNTLDTIALSILRQSDGKTTIEVYKDNLISVLATILNGLAKRLPRDVSSISDNINIIHAQVPVNLVIEVTSNILLILKIISRRIELRVICHIGETNIVTGNDLGVKVSIMLTRPSALAASGHACENIKVSHVYLFLLAFSVNILYHFNMRIVNKKNRVTSIKEVTLYNVWRK